MAAAPAPKVEMEDDGVPVQPPPARAMRPDEDDPSQPWSPNYGKGAAAVAPQRAPNVALPTQVDASAAGSPRTVAWHATADGAGRPASTGSLTQLSNAEADAVIAQAINDQEMRRQ